MRSDDELQQDVLQELRRDPRVEARHLRVEVAAGTVTLTGTVPSCAQATAASAAAARVAGVRDVLSGIQVALTVQAMRSDRDVADAVRRVLEWDAEIPQDSVEARVAGGVVTLAGQVEYEYQRDVAERAVSHLAGVRGIVNRIAVSTPLPRGIRRDVAVLLDWPVGVGARTGDGGRDS